MRAVNQCADRVTTKRLRPDEPSAHFVCGGTNETMPQCNVWHVNCHGGTALPVSPLLVQPVIQSNVYRTGSWSGGARSAAVVLAYPSQSIVAFGSAPGLGFITPS